MQLNIGSNVDPVSVGVVCHVRDLSPATNAFRNDNKETIINSTIVTSNCFMSQSRLFNSIDRFL